METNERFVLVRGNREPFALAPFLRASEPERLVSYALRGPQLADGTQKYPNWPGWDFWMVLQVGSTGLPEALYQMGGPPADPGGATLRPAFKVEPYWSDGRFFLGCECPLDANRLTLVRDAFSDVLTSLGAPIADERSEKGATSRALRELGAERIVQARAADIADVINRVRLQLSVWEGTGVISAQHATDLIRTIEGERV